jgi:hypothetical protein
LRHAQTALLALLLTTPVVAQDTAAIDKAVTEILAKTGAPSASIAIVKDGKIVYTHAYGNAQIDPPRAATPEMRYSIGSISKQFTAAAIQMLQEEGKLSLDDKVVRWLPEPRAPGDVTIRQLLSMTSGYQDFWPQDYVMPGMMKPTTAQEIMNDWGRKALDFEPGTKWQYSNTNYVTFGAIVESRGNAAARFSAAPHLHSAAHDDGLQHRRSRAQQRSNALSALRCRRRPAPKKEDDVRGRRARDDRARSRAVGYLDDRSDDPQAAVLQNDGDRGAARQRRRHAVRTRTDDRDGRRPPFPHARRRSLRIHRDQYGLSRGSRGRGRADDLDATGASGQIATRIATSLFAQTDAASTDLARKIFEGFQKGQIDRSLFTSNAHAYFTDQALADFASSLGPLGKPQEFSQASQSLRGGMTLRRYRIRFPNKTLNVTRSGAGRKAGSTRSRPRSDHDTQVVFTSTTYHAPFLRWRLTVTPPAASGPSPSVRSTVADVEVRRVIFHDTPTAP